MEDPDLSQGDLLADEVDVNLNMLHAPVMDQVDCDVDNAHVVVVDNCGRSERDVEILKKLAKPTTLGNSMGHGPVLNLSTGPGHCGLTLGGPRYQIVPEVNIEP